MNKKLLRLLFLFFSLSTYGTASLLLAFDAHIQENLRFSWKERLDPLMIQKRKGTLLGWPEHIFLYSKCDDKKEGQEELKLSPTDNISTLEELWEILIPKKCREFSSIKFSFELTQKDRMTCMAKVNLKSNTDKKSLFFDLAMVPISYCLNQGFSLDNIHEKTLEDTLKYFDGPIQSDLIPLIEKRCSEPYQKNGFFDSPPFNILSSNSDTIYGRKTLLDYVLAQNFAKESPLNLLKKIIQTLQFFLMTDKLDLNTIRKIGQIKSNLRNRENSSHRLTLNKSKSDQTTIPLDLAQKLVIPGPQWAKNKMSTFYMYLNKERDEFNALLSSISNEQRGEGISKTVTSHETLGERWPSEDNLFPRLISAVASLKGHKKIKDAILREVAIMKMAHKRDRSLFPSPLSVFEIDDKIYIIYPDENKESLTTFLQKNLSKRPMSKDIRNTIYSLAEDLILAVIKLHQNDNEIIIHRDIKPDNILIGKLSDSQYHLAKNTDDEEKKEKDSDTRDKENRMSLNLIDFGHSLVVSPEDKAIQASPNAGTKRYLFPKQKIQDNGLKEKMSIDQLIRNDLWALGLTLYKLFQGKSVSKLKRFIEKEDEEKSSLSERIKAYFEYENLEKEKEVKFLSFIQENPLIKDLLLHLLAPDLLAGVSGEKMNNAITKIYKKFKEVLSNQGGL